MPDEKKMTNKEKLRILRRAKEERRSEVHQDLKHMDVIQENIKITEIMIESLERSIKSLEMEIEKEEKEEFQKRNQSVSQTEV